LPVFFLQLEASIYALGIILKNPDASRLGPGCINSFTGEADGDVRSIFSPHKHFGTIRFISSKNSIGISPETFIFFLGWVQQSLCRIRHSQS